MITLELEVFEKVYLDKKYIGIIKKVNFYWQFFPKNLRKGGEQFRSLQDCIKSLEEENKNE